MGAIVSFLDPRQTKPSTQTNTESESSTASSVNPLPRSTSPSPGRSPRPTHISFAPPPPIFGTLSLSPSSSPSQRENPFERPLLSPALTFYTAPSTPLSSPQVDDPPLSESIPATPPEVVLHVPPPPTPPNELPTAPTVIDIPEVDVSPAHDEAFPNIDQMPVDPFLDDEGLSSLEKIYLFSRSQATFHRVYITHALPSFLEEISPIEAVEYVLPLLSGLAMDPDEQVKEALAAELVPIIWWFFTHCQIVEDDNALPPDWAPQTEPNSVTLISVQAFTPILGTLLLSPNGMVGGPARHAVVDVLSRMRKADEWEEQMKGVGGPLGEKEEDEDPSGLFGSEERRLFQEEILQQVVIGMGRLDAEDGEDPDAFYEWNDQEEQQQEQIIQPEADAIDSPKPPKDDIVNPYFPMLSSTWPAPVAVSEAQAAGSTLAPQTNSLITPTSALASGTADANAVLHVSFAQLSTPPSVVDSYRQPETESNFSPEWSPSGQPLLSPSTAFDPPIARQSRSESDEDNEDTGEADVATDPEGEADEQAAVGRLSSMSLMAAVTASGSLREETKNAFVKEVERVGQDSVYWVRREASFALGALAKIVPEEVVICSLLPIFERLRQDSVWHVRHSALFALPAILTRLTPNQRRSLALDSVVPLSTDESASVRLGVLEALGEVIYTFHEDEDGPPEEILRLFLGRAEDRRLREQQQAPLPLVDQLTKQQIWGAPKSPFGSQVQASPPPDESPLESFFRDPARPLICAFNYPAVALTLGRARWGELRELYVELSQDPAVKVRRTLVASLGELAKIIGPDLAQQDLLHVWWEAIRYEEDAEVRLKAVECVDVFVGALGEGKGKEEVAEGLVDVWREGTLKGWRERKVIASALTGLIASIGQQKPSVIRGLLNLALEDSVAGVREAAISIIPKIWRDFNYRRDILEAIRADIRALAQSSSFRCRMTYIACQQALILPDAGGESVMEADDKLWEDLAILARDEIVGVRIGLSRFIGQLRGYFIRISHGNYVFQLADLTNSLSKDSSPEVRSFLQANQTSKNRSVHAKKGALKLPESFSTFSRPPS